MKARFRISQIAILARTLVLYRGLFSVRYAYDIVMEVALEDPPVMVAGDRAFQVC